MKAIVTFIDDDGNVIAKDKVFTPTKQEIKGNGIDEVAVEVTTFVIEYRKLLSIAKSLMLMM